MEFSPPIMRNSKQKIMNRDGLEVQKVLSAFICIIYSRISPEILFCLERHNYSAQVLLKKMLLIWKKYQVLGTLFPFGKINTI